MAYERLTKRICGAVTVKNDYGADISFIKKLPNKVAERLAELEDKIEQGTLIELPCKVGDTVYYETFINNASESVGIQPHEVKSIYTEIKTSNFSGYGHTIVRLDDIGKTVFLTREEAEAKLKELQE